MAAITLGRLGEMLTKSSVPHSVVTYVDLVRRRRPHCFQPELPNLGLVCFMLMFAVFLVKDACLFSSCRFSFCLVMRLLSPLL